MYQDEWNARLKYFETTDGRFTIEFVHLNAPFNEQTRTILMHAGFEIPSPAQVRYMQSVAPEEVRDDVMKYSRTWMDVVSMPETGKIALVADGLVMRQYGSVENLVEAHRHGEEYVIVPKENTQKRDTLYRHIQDLEQLGLAHVTNAGTRKLATADFGTEPIARFLHSDDEYRIDPAKIGAWLSDEQGNSSITFFLDNPCYVQKQNGIYVNKVRTGGCDYSFILNGFIRDLGNENGGAFGVRFIPALSGMRKNHTLEKRDAEVKGIADIIRHCHLSE